MLHPSFGPSTGRDLIRHAGRILGETVKVRAGERLYNAVETVRQGGVRGNTALVKATLSALTNHECVELARAFSCFGLISNVVDDLERSHSLAVSGSDELGASCAAVPVSERQRFFEV